MQPHQLAAPAIVLALALALAACSNGTDTPPPQSATSSPLTSPTVVQTSPTPDMDALYTEAERIVRRAYELEHSSAFDGTDDYPAELETLLADPYLSWSRAGIQQYHDLGWYPQDGKMPELIVEPAIGTNSDGSEVALKCCLQTVPAVNASGEVVSEAVLWYTTYFFKHVDGDLRLFTATEAQRIDQCPLE